MSEELYTVEQAAGRLKLHPKSVRRAIREGRLRATRVGKSYRILRGDLEAFGGLAPAARPPARATSIVDIPDIDPESAQRLSATLASARMGATAYPDPLHLDAAHDPARRTLKVVIVGTPADTAAMLRIVGAWLER